MSDKHDAPPQMALFPGLEAKPKREMLKNPYPVDPNYGAVAQPESPRPILAPVPTAAQAPAQAPAQPEKKPFPTVPIIRICAGIVGALASAMSWYYSLEWFRDKLPGAWRYIMPIIIVGCSVALPEVCLILFGRKGWKNKGGAAAVLAVGLIASAFSMLSTIAGIYNATSREKQGHSSVLIGAADYTDKKAELTRLDAELARLNVEIDSTQRKVDSIPTEKTQGGDSQALMRRLNAAKKDKSAYEAKREAAAAAVDGLRQAGTTTEVSRQDFSAFIGGVLGLQADQVEFAMAASPALLLDVVAPILFAVSLFL